MTAVFVHGVPETARLWDKARARIGRDSVALSLPGFGTPRPAGFDATMDSYAAWLRDELLAIGEPVDLVGHDWGGILVGRLVTTGFPVRSWASDAVGAIDPGFVWHDFAKLWQTPGDGEAFWDGIRSSPEGSAAVFASIGVPEEDALPMAQAIDEDMCSSILDLYRSAVDIASAWGASASVPTSPGLVLAGAEDSYISADSARRMGEKLGAHVAILEGATHWWPMESAAAEAAAVELRRFWEGIA